MRRVTLETVTYTVFWAWGSWRMNCKGNLKAFHNYENFELIYHEEGLIDETFRVCVVLSIARDKSAQILAYL